MQIYVQHLTTDGLLAFHVTNRYLNLAPVIRALATDRGYEWRMIDNLAQPSKAINFATWIVCTRNAAILDTLSRRASVPTGTQTARVWTDEYNNLLELIR